MMRLKVLETDNAHAVKLKVKKTKHRFDMVIARFEHAEYIHHL